MDLLRDNVGKLYLKYLWASFGSAFIASVYSLVDMAMVGQYHGPQGTAALAVVAPFWNIIYSLGLLIGIGGSILYGVAKGQESRKKYANSFFTASIISGVIIGLLLTVSIWVFEEPLLLFFGADEELLPLCKLYLIAPKFTIPLFVFFDIAASFLRNDNDPSLATKAVIIGGIFNIFGDYFFVFTLNMGIIGAGIATSLGIGISVLVMFTHFLRKDNTLKFQKINNPIKAFTGIVVNGFSAFMADIAMGIMTILFNKTIMHYLGTDELAVYGVIVSIVTFVQCCSYGIGQASQPIFSINFGAEKYDRIKKLLFYSVLTSLAMGIIWCLTAEIIPNTLVNLFMSATPSVLEIAPKIIRIYSISLILLPFNIFSGYYFQATMKAGLSTVISVGRGAVISGALIILLPFLFGKDAVWFAIPITEFVIATFALICIFANLKETKNKGDKL